MWELIAGPILKIIDKVIPDPEARAKAAFELTKLQQEGAFKEMENELQKMQMQADINKIEAASEDPFKSRARPFIIWVCGGSFAYAGIIKPLLDWMAVVLFHFTTPLPVVDVTVMFNLLIAILGLGAYRSYDKKNGTN